MVYTWNRPKSTLRWKPRVHQQNKTVSISNDSGEDTSFVTDDIEPASLHKDRKNMDVLGDNEAHGRSKDYYGQEIQSKKKMEQQTMERQDWTRGNYRDTRGQEKGERSFRGRSYSLRENPRMREDLLNVINLTSIELTEPQKKILSNGFPFSPF